MKNENLNKICLGGLCMLKRSCSLLLVILMLFSLLPTSIMAASTPSIYKDEITVRVGNTTRVDFSYGSSASSAEVFISNTGIDAYITGGALYITGIAEGLSYVTLNFNDGSMDSVKVNVVSQYGNIDNDNNITLKKGNSKNIYIDLDLYDATSATVTYESAYVTVNKTRFTTSGSLKITGKDYGNSVLKIKYNTGDTEIYSVEIVKNASEESYEQNVYLDIDESFNHYVDLDSYDADSATVSYKSSYVSVNRTNFYYSSYLTLTAKREGNTQVTITYDTGDVEYLNVYCNSETPSNSKSSVSVDSIEVEKGDSLYFYVYLGDYADKATLTLDNSCASLSTSTLYNSAQVKITGRTIGEAELKVSFDDGTRFYIPVEVTGENYLAGTAEIDNDVLVIGESANIEIFMGTNNSSATITIDSPKKFTLDVANYSEYRQSYTIYSNKKTTVNVKVTAKDLVDESYITVKFPEGKTYKFMLNVIDLELTEGVDKYGANFVLNKDISTNKSVLNTGYIAGYTDGTFGPLNNITRQEFGVILSRILNYNGQVDSADYLYDVTATWSKDAIAELVAMGVVSRDEAFRPTDYITRYEVAEMLYNVVDLSDYATTCLLSDINSSTLIGRKIAQCYNAGLIAGYSDGTFGGANNITRAEAVTLINRIFYKDINTNKVNIFPDVSESYWAYAHILKATKQ